MEYTNHEKIRFILQSALFYVLIDAASTLDTHISSLNSEYHMQILNDVWCLFQFYSRMWWRVKHQHHLLFEYFKKRWQRILMKLNTFENKHVTIKLLSRAFIYGNVSFALKYLFSFTNQLTATQAEDFKKSTWNSWNNMFLQIYYWFYIISVYVSWLLCKFRQNDDSFMMNHFLTVS